MAVSQNYGEAGDSIAAAVLAENPLPDFDTVFSNSTNARHVHQYNVEKEKNQQEIQDKYLDASLLPPTNSSEYDSKKPLLVADQLPSFYTAFRLGPIAILLALSEGMYSPAYVELLKSRVCEVGLNYSKTVCAHITDPENKAEGDAVRSETARYILYGSLMSSLLPIIFSLFVGAWSDRFGRKMPMLLPFIGMTISNGFVSLIANFNIHPLFFLVSSGTTSLTGGWVILLMAMFSFIGDYATEKNRAMNIAFIDGFLILFVNVGILLGGVLIEKFNLIVPFYVVTAMKAMSILYILVVIRDRKVRPKTDAQNRKGLMSLFTVDNFLDNFRMLKKVRIGRSRSHIALILFNLGLYCICLAGDDSVTQLFLEFAPFKWTVGFYSLFTCIQGLTSSTIIIIAMVFLRKYMGVPDTMIGFLSSFSAIMMFMGYGLSTASWMIYTSAALGCFKMLNIVIVRSLMSGLVDANEIGKGMSLISSIQSVTPMLGGLFFTNIFAATSFWWSGLSFVVSAFLMVPVFAIFGYLDLERRKPEYHTEEPVSFYRSDSADSS